MSVRVLLVGGLLVAFVLVAGAAVVSRATGRPSRARRPRLGRASPRLHRPTIVGRLRQDSGLLLLTGLVVALTTALAATIGIGNIAGVATAFYLGGPGSLFWMWITGLFGMATKYS